MKERKRSYNYLALFNLYLANIFQKSTFIVLFISLIAMVIGVYFSSNPYFELIDYLKNENEFHYLYYHQGLMIIEIFNAIIIATLTIRLIVSSKSFDSLFISYIGKRRLSIIKLLVAILIIFMITIFECIIINVIGLIRYKNYKLDINGFISFLYLFLLILFELIISFSVTELINNIFSPMIILFISVIYKIIVSNYNVIKDYTKLFIPNLSFDYKTMCLTINNPLILGIWILSFVFIYMEIYSIKDL